MDNQVWKQAGRQAADTAVSNCLVHLVLSLRMSDCQTWGNWRERGLPRPPHGTSCCHWLLSFMS